MKNCLLRTNLADLAKQHAGVVMERIRNCENNKMQTYLYRPLGIGRAITLALVNRGCQVLAIGRSPDNLKALRELAVSLLLILNVNWTIQYFN